MRILFAIFLVISLTVPCEAFEFQWQIDETPEGSESVTVIEPVKVVLLDEVVEIPPHSASLTLIRRYSVYLGTEWSQAHAYQLLQTFKSIPQDLNSSYGNQSNLEPSLWRLSDRHLLNDIDVEYHDGQRIVTLASEAFVNATPLLAEIDGIRGKYFSKRLHHAVMRFVTDNGTDRYALERILRDRYAVSVSVPDYTELTRHTTGEHAGRFSNFKNEELMAIVSMFEEMPSGMLKTPGLKYLVRRLDGLPHPLYPAAAAVAWPGAGYIEFMESAFKDTSPEALQRLILHEKAHFLWAHLFDEQLRQDWIQLGGWYKNPEDVDGWSTTQQTTFVSSYAHGINPNEDMAESIGYYIVNPDKLRSRAPAKYEFIQNRVMHGTRYISRIRKDLTFQVYNLYPDYVYPGRIVRVNVHVDGAPTEDKQITAEIEIHRDSELDSAQSLYTRIFSEKGTYFDLRLSAIDKHGQHIAAGHLFRGYTTLSRYAAMGYWGPDSISLTDANGNERHEAQTDFGWKLYIDNPLADCEPPEYVPNSIRLTLSKASTNAGHEYQILTAHWQLIETSGIQFVCASLNDDHPETYSHFKYGNYDTIANEATVQFPIPDHFQTGTYELNRICMKDIANNQVNVYFTHPHHTEPWSDDVRILDERPVSIHVTTATPDILAPVLDLNRITIKAVPTRPEAPNGETRVDIKFRVRDDIAGYDIGSMSLRDPHGVMHHFWHYPPGRGHIYFTGDPSLYQAHEQTIILPVGSIPGTWGLANMTLRDKALNFQQYDFTELVRFEVNDGETWARLDVNNDNTINVLDLVIVAQSIGEQESEESEADVNSDGKVNVLDLVQIANQFSF